MSPKKRKTSSSSSSSDSSQDNSDYPSKHKSKKTRHRSSSSSSSASEHSNRSFKSKRRDERVGSRKHSKRSPSNSDSEEEQDPRSRREHKHNPKSRSNSHHHHHHSESSNRRTHEKLHSKKSRYDERDSSDGDYKRKSDHRNDRDRRDRDHDRDKRQRGNNRDVKEKNDRPPRTDSGKEPRSRSNYDSHRNDHKNENSKFRDRSPRRDKNRGRRSSPFDHSNAKWGKADQDEAKPDVKADKEKPNFALSGKLTEERNTFKGVVIKYSEPPEARKPKRRWRLYPFKGEQALQTLYIHRQSGYLIGRDRKIADLPVDHPSCSKQHAALQYRLVPFTRDDGSVGKRVRPYIIDLDSANGTYINNKRIESKKYVELLERDVIKFGYSSREYVLLHENSKDETQDDDVKVEDEEVVDVKVEEAAE